MEGSVKEFLEEEKPIEITETEEICPIMSSQGFSPIRCRIDCAWFRHTEGACAIHVISSRRG